MVSIVASKKDGSLSVLFNYCKAKNAYSVRHRFRYIPGKSIVRKDEVIHEFKFDLEVDMTAKVSLHQSGFIQLSGKGINSGIDEETGHPKGVGVFSRPLATPVNSGPTIAFSCWGVSKGFELLGQRKPGVQYIIFKESDFIPRNNGLGKSNTYHLEFFIFSEEANNSIYEYEDAPYLNYVADNYIHNPGAVFAQPVLDLSFFKGVISVCPFLGYTQFAGEHPYGYLINSPSGTDSLESIDGPQSMFHVICPRNPKHSFIREQDLPLLTYEN